jgi:hypothetical protein
VSLQAELEINRKNTVAFIAARPSEVTLTPRTKTETSGGGWKWVVGAPREPQTLRIIELGMQVTPPILELSNGKQRRVDFWLLGPHDATIEVGDFWVAEDGRTWEVGEVVRDNGYEVRGLVAERGE